MRAFIETCADIEVIAAQIYRELSRHSADNPRLYEIMERMALDEEDHALQLRLALRVATDERFSGVNEKVGDPFVLRIRANQLLLQARELVAVEEDILRIAIELEMEFLKIHAGYSLLFKEPVIKKLFTVLARGDELHVDSLKAYLRDYLELKNDPG